MYRSSTSTPTYSTPSGMKPRRAPVPHPGPSPRSPAGGRTKPSTKRLFERDAPTRPWYSSKPRARSRTLGDIEDPGAVPRDRVLDPLAQADLRPEAETFLGPRRVELPAGLPVRLRRVPAGLPRKAPPLPPG